MCEFFKMFIVIKNVIYAFHEMGGFHACLVVVNDDVGVVHSS